jgi:hypothetical protein
VAIKLVLYRQMGIKSATYARMRRRGIVRDRRSAVKAMCHIIPNRTRSDGIEVSGDLGRHIEQYQRLTVSDVKLMPIHP